MSNVNPFGGSTILILVILTILAFVELSQSCHRRVEYHHYYKKRPHKGGHGGHHGGGYGHMGGGGHSKGYGGHHGHSKGHGGHGGHSKGYGGHDEGYGHSKGYGNMGGGHEGGGYGHMMKGYGQGDQYGHGGGGGHHKGGHGEGYHGGGHAGGHHKGGHGEGYHGGGGHQSHGYGGHGEGHHHGDGDEYEHDTGGHGHGGHKGKKGHKYKYQSYESMHYNDKDGRETHNSPHYMKQGYGYSGPYPNTEYSAPVVASVHPPDDEVASGANINSFDVITPHLDAADTANLIRNSFDSKENDILSPSHNFGMVTGSSSLSTGRGTGTTGMSNLHGRPSGSGMIPTPTMQLSSGSSQEGVSGGIRESKVDPSLGNFDLNLSYNSDLPDPFQREFSEVKNGSPGIVQRKRKRISSKYRNRPSTSSSSTMDSGESQQYQSQVTFPQSDPMNDATESKKSPEMIDFMNF